MVDVLPADDGFPVPVKKLQTNTPGVVTVPTVPPAPNFANFIKQTVQNELQSYVDQSANNQIAQNPTTFLGLLSADRSTCTSPAGITYGVAQTIGIATGNYCSFFVTGGSTGIAYFPEFPQLRMDSSGGKAWVIVWDGVNQYWVRAIGGSTLYPIDLTQIPDNDILMAQASAVQAINAFTISLNPDGTYLVAGLPDTQINTGGNTGPYFAQFSPDGNSLVIGSWYQSYNVDQVNSAQSYPGVPQPDPPELPNYTNGEFTSYESFNSTYNEDNVQTLVSSGISQQDTGVYSNAYAVAAIFHGISYGLDQNQNPILQYTSVERLKINLDNNINTKRAVPPLPNQIPEAQYIWYWYAGDANPGGNALEANQGVPLLDIQAEEEIIGDAIGIYAADAGITIDPNNPDIQSLINQTVESYNGSSNNNPNLTRFFPMTSSYYNTTCPPDFVTVDYNLGYPSGVVGLPNPYSFNYSSTQFGNYTASWVMDTNSLPIINNVVFGFSNDANGNPVLDIAVAYQAVTIAYKESENGLDAQTYNESSNTYSPITDTNADQSDNNEWHTVMSYSYSYTWDDDWPYTIPLIEGPNANQPGRGLVNATSTVTSDPKQDVYVEAISLTYYDHQDTGTGYEDRSYTTNTMNSIGYDTLYPLDFNYAGLNTGYREVFSGGEGTSEEGFYAFNGYGNPLVFTVVDTSVVLGNADEIPWVLFSGEADLIYNEGGMSVPLGAAYYIDESTAGNTEYTISTYDGYTVPAGYPNDPTFFSFLSSHPPNGCGYLSPEQYYNIDEPYINGYYFCRAQVLLNKVNTTLAADNQIELSFIGRPPYTCTSKDTIYKVFRNVAQTGTATVYFESWFGSYWYVSPFEATGLDPQTQVPDVFTDQIMSPYQTFPYLADGYKALDSYAVAGYWQSTDNTDPSNTVTTESVTIYLINPLGSQDAGATYPNRSVVGTLQSAVAGYQILDMGINYTVPKTVN